MLLTRCVEFDSVGNAERLFQALPVRVLYGHYPPEEWVYIRTDRPADLPYEGRMMAKHDTIYAGRRARRDRAPGACACSPAHGCTTPPPHAVHVGRVLARAREGPRAAGRHRGDRRHDGRGRARAPAPASTTGSRRPTPAIRGACSTRCSRSTTGRRSRRLGLRAVGRAVVERHRALLDEALRLMGEGLSANGRSSA